MKRLLLLASIIWLAVAAAVGAPAINCSGVVVDAENEPIIGATVLVPGTKAATATNIDGKFTLKVPENGKEIRISFIGYKTAVLKPAADMGTIVLEQETLMLNDVVVTQSVGKNRETPVAMSTIDAAAIEYKLGNQELLEVLKTTPGVYTRSEGGGFGDAKTRMRGFYSGEITNWKEVGGSDAPIVCIGREAASGTRDGFEEVTGTKDKCKYSQELTSTGDVVQTVSGNPNAIGYASVASVGDTVKMVSVEGVSPTTESIQDGKYKVQRNFVLVTKKDTALSKAAQEFFDFATSEQADSLITEAGAVPVKR